MHFRRSGACAPLLAFALAATPASADTLTPQSLANLAPGAVVAIELPQAAAVPVVIEHRRDLGPGRFMLAGRPAGEAGRFVVAVRGDAVAGVLQSGGVLRRLHDAGPGPLVIETVDAAALPPCGGALAPPLAIGGGAPGGGPGDGEGVCDDGTEIGLVVVYTPAARASAGDADAILAIIDLMVADANEAYANTLLDLELRLLYAAEIDHDETGNLLQQLTTPGDGEMDEAHALRDAYGADLVALVHSGGGGVAWGLGNLAPGSASIGFSSNGLQSAVNMVLAHEIGHNLGCCHAVGDGGGCGVGLLFPFSNGHRFPGASGTLWRTVMAYSPGQRIAHYSSPDIEFDDMATGIPESPAGGADNKRTIEASQAHVANYRCASTVCADLDLPPDAEDCNDNGVPDACEFALGWATDDNDNGVIDDCECLYDTNGDGVLDGTDCLNDACVAATDVGAGTITFSTVQADTDGPADNACSHDGSAQIFKDRWFRYLPPVSGNVTAHLCGSDFDTRLAVYAGACPVVVNQALACDDDGVCGQHGSVTFSVTAGVPHYLRVGGFQNAAGQASLTIEEAVAVSNDGCGTPAPLAAGATPFTTNGATSGGPAETAACGGVIDRDIWFRHTAAADGPISVRACDADFDVALAVYGGCPGGAGEVLACSDDSIWCAGTGARVVFAATAGVSYRVRVGSRVGTTGVGTLVVETGAAVCPTDVTADGVTDVADLQAVLDRYGTICAGCAEDVVFDGQVNVNDLVAVFEGWGGCGGG